MMFLTVAAKNSNSIDMEAFYDSQFDMSEDCFSKIYEQMSGMSGMPSSNKIFEYIQYGCGHWNEYKVVEEIRKFCQNKNTL